ncbi:MAG: SGNH/GDSL hydrolase family protein [Microcoleaceae cyanobacterium MO_207.B10]|nr:SGNH/GDSL hydrolase family protein [Microcoleaceae cyanobacterium MO_207.B10]
MKKVFSVLSQTLIISLITFCLTEITFRIYHKINPSFMFYDTNYNRWRGKPHAEDYNFKLNSQGFKDVEYSPKKDKDIYRIIGIGDSFAFGVVPYKYNYLTVLEEQINQNQSQKIELINMGIAGIGPKDYLALLVNEGLAFNPDMVLLSFYIGNDFLDNSISEKNRRNLKENDSYVFSFFRSLIEIHSKYQGNIYHQDTEYKDDQPTFSDEAYLKMLIEKSPIFIAKPAEPEHFQRLFNDALGDLLKIKEICDYKNIKLVVILIPDELQMDKKLQAQVAKDFNVSPDIFDFSLPNKLLSQEFEKYNIHYIDVLDEFQAVATEKRLYKPNNTHWNISGNQFAADLIENYLQAEFFNKKM